MPPADEKRIMTLAPLLAASPVIQAHAYFAFAAIGLGGAQMLAPKGTGRHRAMGWAWVVLMMAVAGSSLFIHTIRLWGAWSPIHLLSLFTLATVPLAVSYARRGNLAQHQPLSVRRPGSLDRRLGQPCVQAIVKKHVRA